MDTGSSLPQPEPELPAAAWPKPPLLPGFGEGQSYQLRQALHNLLLDTPGQLGRVYAAYATRPDAKLTELAEEADLANSGVAGNLLVTIKAVADEQYPDKAPTRARQSASAVRSLLKRSTSLELSNHLTKVSEELQARADDPTDSQAETKALEAQSKELEEVAVLQLESASGVYVYTYPHYYKYPYEAGTGRRLLKVGRTEHGAWKRVLSQARSTGAPENPLLLRVYVADSATAAEGSFHKLLDAAQHARSEGSAAGREWFSTTIDFLDAIATALSLQIIAPSSESAD